MSDILNEKIIDKLLNMESDLREGIICFTIALVLSLFSWLWTNFINYYWLLLIAGDFLVYSFILIGKFSYRFNNYISIGKGSVFTTNSLFLRLSRIFLYSVIVQMIFFQTYFTFLNVMFAIFSVFFFGVVAFNLFSSENEHSSINKFYIRHQNTIKLLLFISTLTILGIMMRIYDIYSIGTWDEGWFVSVTTHMFQTQNWLQPLYYDDSTGQLLLFDKPPLMFILGSIGIALFNYTSIAIKWPMGILSGLMGITGYFIYEHQRRIDKSEYIPAIIRDEKSEESFKANMGPDEETLKTSDGKVVGLIFGLSMAVTWFLIFYARTAYLDAAIVAITAFTALFAVKAIDHWFYGNRKRAYVYIFLTAFINMLDLLAKAWQGLIVGPSIAIYLFAKYYEYFIPRQNLYDFLQNVKKLVSINTSVSKVVAVISSIITILAFDSFIPNIDANHTICANVNILDPQKDYSSCITFVPNFTLNLFGFTLDIWAVVLSIFVFGAVVGFTEYTLKTLNKKLYQSEEQKLNENNEFLFDFKNLSKSYPVIIIIALISVVGGIVGTAVGGIAFEFFYDRFYAALTEIFVQYFTYTPVNQSLFIGTLIDGSIAIIFGGLLAVLFVWIALIFLTAVIDTILRVVLKMRLFYNNFSTKIVAEWSLLIPLSYYGIFLGYWTYFLLFKGDIFHRDTVMLMVVGVILCFLSYLLGSITVDILKYFYSNVFKNNPENQLYKNWISGINKLLIFLTVMSIFIILSFYPFVAWVNFMDQYIVGHPYSIRLPGELSGVPNIPQPLTYSWLFFEYYVNWRYTGKGSQYSVVSSLGGLISPLFLACIPFLITGIYALIKRRDLGTLLFYGSWTFIVLITFLPAKFQLNYYYLAIFFPYFALTSYGLFWSVRSTKSSINFKNMGEKLLLTIPILLLISISLLVPFLTTYNLLQSQNFYIFILSVIFIVGGFAVCAILFTRSIPESFALAFIIFYLYNNLIAGGIGNTDTGFLIVSAVLIGIPIYLVRDRIPFVSAVFLFLIIMTPVTTTAGWVHYKSQDDDQFQQIGQFVLDHQGNYNYSTWVYPDAGARYAMRYYLGGLYLWSDQPTTRNLGDWPFSYNTSAYMNSFMKSNPNVKFFVITTTASGYADATTTWSAAYDWLINSTQSNFVFINPLMHKPSGQHVQFFASKSVLSQAELNSLGIQS